MKKHYTVFVTAPDKSIWCLRVKADPSWVVEWREAGLEVHEEGYRIPAWAVRAGLLRPYMFFVDAWKLIKLW